MCVDVDFNISYPFFFTLDPLTWKDWTAETVIQETGQWNCSRLSKLENMTVVIVFLSEAIDCKLLLLESDCSLGPKLFYIYLLHFYFERIWVEWYDNVEQKLECDHRKGQICEVLQTMAKWGKKFKYINKYILININKYIKQNKK